MLKKAMKTLAPQLFLILISSDKMSALCDMICNINNVTFWFESSKIVQTKMVQDDIAML